MLSDVFVGVSYIYCVRPAVKVELLDWLTKIEKEEEGGVGVA